MAERYQDRLFPAHDDYGRGSDPHGQKAEGDPLAELARLIGQNDPFATGRTGANVAAPRQQAPHAQQQYQPESYEPEDAYEPEPERPAGPPPWMQRANQRAQQPAPPSEPQYLEQQYDDEPEFQPSPVHPLHRYAQQPAAPAPQPQYQQQYVEEPEADPSRYDDALYGQLESAQDYQREPAYPDDPYAYQGAYDEEAEEQPRKRGGMVIVAAVVALAVLGTGAAFAYRSFFGASRSGEPPVIRADNSPTKIVPAQSDAPKAPDRMAFGDGSEKIVPREENPVDINSRSGPRVVFPPLNQNANPPPPSSVAPNAPMPAAPSANGTMPNNQPRPIRTVTVKGDATDAGMPPAAPGAVRSAAPAQVAAPRPAPPATRNPPSAANASANAPLSLTPGAAEPAEPSARMAAVNPAEPATSGGGYVVQVSSQKSEADAQASYRALQSKYGSVLGSRSPVVKRVDLTDKGKGIVYRAYAGPFASSGEATKTCTDLKAAGLSDCYIHKN